MIAKENIIRNYFKAWLNKDDSYLQDTFDESVIYSECYGPEYQGINQILQWFDDWNQRGKVVAWDIKRFIHQENVSVVEWYFECNDDGNVSGFDGVSMIEFNNEKIIALREFKSEPKHIYPYGRN